MAYEPRQGGTAQRAIDHLKRTKPHWLPLTKLASELDVTYAVLISAITMAMQRGLLTKFRYEGAVCTGLPDKEPAGAKLSDGRIGAGEDDSEGSVAPTAQPLGWKSSADVLRSTRESADEPEADTSTVASSASPEPPSFVRSVLDAVTPLVDSIVGKAVDVAAPGPTVFELAAGPKPLPGPFLRVDQAKPEEHFACALFNDGRFLFETGGMQVMLPSEHTDQLVKYIARVWNGWEERGHAAS